MKQKSIPKKVIQTVNFEIPRWQTAAILKSLKRHISIKKCPILMKFGAQKQNSDKDDSHFTEILLFQKSVLVST